MAIVTILIIAQIVLTLGVVFFLKKYWDRQLMEAAIEEFESCNASPQITEVSVRYASGISDEFRSRIETICRRKFARARLVIQVDPNLKGGMVITAGDLSLDYSLSGN